MIAVKPCYQGQGYAFELIGKAEEISRQDGMKAMRLEVRQDNSRAIHFYLKNGYRVIEDRDGRYLMEKMLDDHSSPRRS